jgi:hypothetical protein
MQLLKCFRETVHRCRRALTDGRNPAKLTHTSNNSSWRTGMSTIPFPHFQGSMVEVFTIMIFTMPGCYRTPKMKGYIRVPCAINGGTVEYHFV